VKTYHGERTVDGCTVTVDGRSLRVRSDLSGNATTGFDWGYVGGGQLSLALLSDFLGNHADAKAAWEAFEEAVVARLPRDSWTITGRDVAAALARLPARPRPAGTTAPGIKFGRRQAGATPGDPSIGGRGPAVERALRESQGIGDEEGRRRVVCRT
jgi:hypothetical protein